MYDSIANADSELVLVGLALDTGRRSLGNGSASLGSTPVASLGSTPVTPARSVMKPGFGMLKFAPFLRICLPPFIQLALSIASFRSGWRLPTRHPGSGRTDRTAFLAQVIVVTARRILHGELGSGDPVM